MTVCPQEIRDFLEVVENFLEPKAYYCFGGWEKRVLAVAMIVCGLKEYPLVFGDPQGVLASGETVCEVCGQKYRKHPPDWRLTGYNGLPFLEVLCDGRRVKL